MFSRLAHSANQDTLETVAEKGWDLLAKECWEGYLEKGRGYFLFNQQQDTEGYWGMRVLEGNFGNADALELLREKKGVDTDLLMKQLREYDPRREIVLLLIPSDSAIRRSLVPRAPGLMDLIMRLDSEETPVSGVFGHDPPPPSFAPPSSEREKSRVMGQKANGELDFEAMARGADLLKGILHALTGTGEKQGETGSDERK